MKQLGEVLLEEGLVNETQLMTALDEQIVRGTSLGRVLVELGILSEDQLVRALAAQVGMEFVDLDEFVVDRRAVQLLPGAVCRRYTVLPIAIRDDYLVLAMADPGNVMALDDVRALSRMQVHPVVAAHDNLLRGIDRHCRADGEIGELAGALEEATQ